MNIKNHYNLIPNNAHVLARTLSKLSCTLERKIEEEHEVHLFSNEMVNDYSSNESNDLFSNEVIIGDNTNDSLDNEIVTGDSTIEQQLDSKCTVNDKVSYTKNSNNF